MATVKLEDRVAALEKEVARLKEKVDGQDQKTRWWEKIAGSFAGDRMYAEAMRLGREHRESLRPKARKAKTRSRDGEG